MKKFVIGLFAAAVLTSVLGLSIQSASADWPPPKMQCVVRIDGECVLYRIP